MKSKSFQQTALNFQQKEQVFDFFPRFSKNHLVISGKSIIFAITNQK